MTPRTSKVKEKVGSDTVLDSTPWWARHLLRWNLRR